ncbi:thioredoxin domain-containing protein [Natrialbaceae archaeon AArc-T1-2]|uniref:thioredoxin domain-containing protein n=1 Tax=Natrialbaceae archaeon AArc-T1-2 TaxID=3053904 RepID=UPI00255A9974|nr:thioredoxin domain-containing protein [Natrialbaceae archaeon AArc-T1-2]WIV67083.1 thioredoxin domain-containing protein [Natrialbaceae archaeon AArc-T1-2]
METPTQRNRLDEEESPYLRQHADNPVNWQPWDDEALERAREHDVPIFLSIGYSACHWCHVMEEESFADEEVAETLNESFVPIKVDREERPDIDSIYMTVCQIMTEQGGWPLSVWLTPEGKPFFVGTYYPKRRKRGVPGFLEVLEEVTDAWENRRDDVEQRADQWTKATKDRLESTPSAMRGGAPPSSGVLETAASEANDDADPKYGGFGASSGPKFPQTSRLHALARTYDRTGEEAYLETVTDALDAMANGGLYDHVGGGFHRYCVDRQWTVPHFEKMLYDNAEIPRAFLAGYQLTGDDRYAEVVEQTFEFLDREMTHEDGGFFSTLDARNENEEGEQEEGHFYVWTPEKVTEAVDDETDAKLFRYRYGISEDGNFEGDTVLNVTTSIADLADVLDLEESDVERRLESAHEEIFDAREERSRPARDEKVLAGWNGLMISTLAEGAIVLGDDAYVAQAVDALEFVREQLWDAETSRLNRRYKDGDVAVDGYLEDYAFLARGALDCYQATGNVDHLAFALELARAIEAEFFDPEAGTLYFTPESGESLVTRPQELDDASTPSSTGVAVDVLLSLSHFADADFEQVAGTVLQTHADRLEGSPLAFVTLCLAADQYNAGELEITVAAAELPRGWRDRFGEAYLPDRLLARRPPTADGLEDWLEALDLEEPPTIWADREAREGEPTLYVCRARTCSPPVQDVEAALEWIGEVDPADEDEDEDEDEVDESAEDDETEAKWLNPTDADGDDTAGDEDEDEDETEDGPFGF